MAVVDQNKISINDFDLFDDFNYISEDFLFDLINNDLSNNDQIFKQESFQNKTDTELKKKDEVYKTDLYKIINDKEFNEHKYKFIASGKYLFFNNYLKKVYPNYALNNDDNFMTLKYEFNTFSLEPIAETFGYREDENMPFCVNILDDSLVFDFIHFESLQEKIYKCPNRYLALEITLVSNLKKDAHSVLFVFDKNLMTSFVIDSNGNKLEYFDDFQFNSALKISEHLKNALSQYSNMLGFNYVSLADDLNIDLSINNFILNEKQKDFFKGYCRGWSYYFQGLIIKSEKNNSYDIIEEIKKINQENVSDLNVIIQNYQNSFFKEIIDMYPIDFISKVISSQKCDCGVCI